MTTLLKTATFDDMSFIVDQQKRFSSELGFVPLSAIRMKIEQRRYTILEVNGQDAAYCYTSGGIMKPLKIVQHTVTEELWRKGFGQLLFQDAARKAYCTKWKSMHLHCREGLPANQFWRAMRGEITERIDRPTSRKKSLLHWIFTPETTESIATSA